MKHRSKDGVFFTLVLTLSLVGIIVYSSATLGFLARENNSVPKDILLQSVIGLGIGFLALFLVSALPLQTIKKAAPYLYVVTLLLTCLVFVPGLGFHSGGATRWIDLGFTTIQPAEFLKIGYVLMLSWWLAPRARTLADPRQGILAFVAITAIPAAILLAQPNTSTTVLIGATGLAMYLASGAPWRDIGVFVITLVLGLGVIIAVRPYVLERFKTFFDPSANALGSGYQIQQSMIAIGSGRFIGHGLGQGVEKFNYLPEPSGDSVFAVLAEETGFVGSVILLILFVALVARGVTIAGQARDLFQGLVAFGFSILIVLQVFINISAMLGIIPLTGLPLPFVSHGGTALLAMLIMCGFILNAAHHKKA